MLRRSSLWITCVFLFASSSLAAPNLVPNPSFENHSQCPSAIDLNTGQLHFANSWTRAQSTPDYYNHCGLINSVKTPPNAMGSQCPYGSTCGSTPPGAYAGFVAYQAQATDARELLQTSLSQPLTAGFKYRIRFYVSLAEFFEYGVDRLGAQARVGAVNPNNVPNMNFDVQNPPQNVISDKSNWTMISGVFTASGGEDHVVFGNLASDANTMALSTGSGGFTQAYYYIDMVSVRRADITDIQILPPPNGGAPWEATLTGASPNSPATLYCSPTLGGSDIQGVESDLGGTPTVLATATTDAAGNATFQFSQSQALACADVLGRFHVEAQVEDPSNGDRSDSDEETIDLTPTDVAPGGAAAALFGRVAASPNPFNPMTTVSYELQQPASVHLEVFDAAGRSVRVLEEYEMRLAGRHLVTWNGRDQRGRTVSAGTYFARLQSGGEARTMSLVLVK